jgi:uncharacterized protein (TIGR04255 family)
MSTRLAFDDFKPVNVTCELRYRNAYLVYDRTGHVIKDVSEAFTNVVVQAAAPQQTAFTSDEGSFTLEIGACRFTAARFERNGETFARQCKLFFGSAANELEIGVFTRIGLRYISRLEFKTLQESKAALASMMLANLKPTKRFNSSDSPTEVMFRWEDEAIGAVFRLRAETADIKISAPPELRDYVPAVDKNIIGLTLDIDYYTVATVEREQWDAREWIVEKLRIIRKEADGILQGAK